MRRWIEVWLEAIWLGIKQAAIRFATENPDAVIGGLIGLVSAIIRATGALVESGHAGLLFSFGRAKKVVSPGFQLLIPFLQIVRIMPVRSQTINLAAQQVTTLDGLVYDVDSILVYRISDVRKAFIEIDDLKKGMIQTLGLSVQEVLCTLERHSLKVSDSLNDTLAERMADIYADLWIKIAGHALDAVGDNVDVIALGDDLSSQAGPIFSPEIYRAVIKPRHARMFAAVKARTDAKLLYHSCGGIFDYVEDLVEIGVDAINPVQVNAAGMEPARLKKTFGDRLAFWGGVDTQHVLPYGTVDEVRAETRRMIDILGKGGGYVLNSVHTIQPEVPAANVAAMFDAGRMHS